MRNAAQSAVHNAALAALQNAAEALLNVRVGIRSEDELDARWRDKGLAEAQPL